MTTSASVSVGHGPGTPRNEGNAKDRSTPVPDSNLTEIDATEEPIPKQPGQDGLLPVAKTKPAQPR